jgi:hypothetical protein
MLYIYKYLYDFLARDIHVGREIPPTRLGFQHRSMGKVLLWMAKWKGAKPKSKKQSPAWRIKKNWI